jgi:hypothetical protein
VTTKLPVESQHYDPNNSARIRLFGQNQKPSSMEVQMGQGADAKPVQITVGGSFGDAFGSFLRVTKNESIGIAETENTRNLAARNGILSKAFYREFVIPAGRPVKVRNSFIGLTSVTPLAGGGSITQQQGSCSSGTVSFVPQAGKDYEVGFYKFAGACSVVVFDIQTVDGKTTLVPLPVEH